MYEKEIVNFWLRSYTGGGQGDMGLEPQIKVEKFGKPQKIKNK